MKSRTWIRGVRPLIFWGVIILLLLGYRLHQRWMEKTRLEFLVEMMGKPLDAEASLDGKPALSGGKIGLGNHSLKIAHPKAEPFTTNLWVWYGNHNLGTLSLPRATSLIQIRAEPAANRILIHGPEFNRVLTQSSGTNLTVPADTYEITAEYPYWKERRLVAALANTPAPVEFTPQLGTLALTCNRPGATFELENPAGTIVETGTLPATVSGLPIGNYRVNARFHSLHQQQSVSVAAHKEVTIKADFFYGQITIQTEPNGVYVLGGDGQTLGQTPLVLKEVTTGRKEFTLELAGYQRVRASVNLEDGQSVLLQTNLISVEYLRLMELARENFAAKQYASAEGFASEARKAKPGDEAALKLKREAGGLKQLEMAKSKIAAAEYIAAAGNLNAAAMLLPDNEEVKSLMLENKDREAEQKAGLEKDARRARPKAELLKMLLPMKGEAAFEAQEMKLALPASQVAMRLPSFLQGPVRKLVITETAKPNSDITTVVIKQGGTQSARICFMVIGQAADDETVILFKVVEFANVSADKDSLAAVLDNSLRDYQVLQPSAGGWTRQQNTQIEEGIQTIRDLLARTLAGG